MLSLRRFPRLCTQSCHAPISLSLLRHPTSDLRVHVRLLSTSFPLQGIKDLRKAVQEGDGKLIDKLMSNLIHDSMPEERRRDLLRHGIVLEILRSQIPLKLVKSLLSHHHALLTSKHSIALIHRCSDHPAALIDVAHHCLVNFIRLPLNAVESCASVIFADNRLVALRMYMLFDHETDEDSVPDFVVSFQRFLFKFRGLDPDKVSQDSASGTLEETMIKTLMHPDFEPPIFLSHFRTLILEHLHPLIAMKCVDYFIEEDVIPSLLRGSPFEGKHVPNAADIKEAKLSFQQATEITYRAHGFLLVLAPRSSEEREGYREQMVEYLQQRHGITNIEKNPGIKLSKRESLINKLYSAVRVSASLRRGGGITLSRNPVSVYVSPTELLQSLLPSLKTMECMAPGNSQIFKYRDPMAGSKVNALQEIFGDEISKLKELQWKR